MSVSKIGNEIFQICKKKNAGPDGEKPHLSRHQKPHPALKGTSKPLT